MSAPSTLLCVLFILSSYIIGSCISEGDPCDGGNGICRQLEDCIPAFEAVKLRKRHTFKRCGFVGFTEVVCCPNSDQVDVTVTERVTHKPISPHTLTPVIDRVGKRKSAQVCEEFSRDIKPSISFHIIEGEDADVGEFPHMVAIGYNSDTIGVLKWTCGGSLIATNYVLTAAHCIINTERNAPVKVKLGTIFINGSLGNKEIPQEYDIINITIHPDYKWREKLNDIALLKLNDDITITENVHPACLYNKNDDPIGLVVSGWGVTENAGEQSSILQRAKLTSVSLRECNITMLTRSSRYLISSQICASDDKSDTCQGDSGGPLQVQNKPNSSIYTIVGITSYGSGCGSKYPGIYTRVSSYLDWIESIVWNNST